MPTPTCNYDLDCTRATSALYAAQSWVAMGGSVNKAITAVAVGMAESCLDPYATSTTCAVGVWQIEPDSLIAGRPSMQDLTDIGVNAKWAVTLSNAGSDWSAWDSCYAAGESLTKRYSLANPEPGSKAAAMIPVATAALRDASYSSVRSNSSNRISMLTTVVNDCPGGWNPECYDLGGTYTITPSQGLQYLRNAGFSGGDDWYALGIMSLESSFTPDVIAHCNPGTCQSIAVDAIGLMQIYWEVHQNYDFNSLKLPQYNCNAAHDLFMSSGWTPWPHPTSDVMAEVSRLQPLIDAGSSANNGTSSPPGISLPGDILASQPPSLIAPGQQPVVTPPEPQITVNYIDNPAQYSTARSGWDAVTWHYTNDVPYYSGYAAEIVRRLSTLTGG